MKVVLLIALSLVLSGCVVIQGTDSQTLELKKSDGGLYLEEANPVVERLLRATVKGSIYGTGEFMSVFGTCLDGDDLPVNDTYATFNAWYPNGTQFIFNDSMYEIEEGYYVWHGDMSVVGGTYLTEMTCRLVGYPDVIAKAWGEWQNPVWVEQIGNTSADVQNISIVLGDINDSMYQQFNITFDKLDSLNATLNFTYENLSEQIWYVGQVANNSVDRNDSLLYYMLLNLTGLVTPVNYTGIPVNWTEDYTYPTYRDTWEMRVDAFDPADTSQRLTYPDVLCTINTTGTPVAVQMDVQGNHFVYDEVIYIRGTWDWTVSCYYA